MICDCSQLVVSLSSISMLCDLTVDGCKRMARGSPTMLQQLKSFTLSNISDYGNWLKWGFPSVENLQSVVKMSDICGKMKFLLGSHQKGCIASPPSEAYAYKLPMSCFVFRCQPLFPSKRTFWF